MIESTITEKRMRIQDIEKKTLSLYNLHDSMIQRINNQIGKRIEDSVV